MYAKTDILIQEVRSLEELVAMLRREISEEEKAPLVPDLLKKLQADLGLQESKLKRAQGELAKLVDLSEDGRPANRRYANSPANHTHSNPEESL